MNDQDRTRVRREELGFVYQFHHLLPEFSAPQNVVNPAAHPRPVRRRKRKDRATQLLTFFGFGERPVHRPGELSGGEQQRVAIARAVANARAPCSQTSPPVASTPIPPTASSRPCVAIVRASKLAGSSRPTTYSLAPMDRRVTIRDGPTAELPKIFICSPR